MPCVFDFQRNAGVKPDNEAVKQAIATSSPLIVFGSYNERMYMAESNSRSIYINASFPGAAIRRHTGTPFMGYAGCTWIMQEVCNALFDALFFILPLSTMMDKADATPSRLLEAVGWEDEARSELDRIVDKEPVLVRISAAKRLRDAAERAARDAGEKLVTVDRLRSAVRLYEAQAA
jgi:chlorophyllide a reductase subunit Z